MKDRKSGRNTGGAFAAGNPRKPKGARHKATRAALALLNSEAEPITAAGACYGRGAEIVKIKVEVKQQIIPKSHLHYLTPAA